MDWLCHRAKNDGAVIKVPKGFWDLLLQEDKRISECKRLFDIPVELIQEVTDE